MEASQIVPKLMERPFRSLLTEKKLFPSLVMHFHASVPSAGQESEGGMTWVGEVFDYVGCFSEAMFCVDGVDGGKEVLPGLGYSTISDRSVPKPSYNAVCFLWCICGNF